MVDGAALPRIEALLALDRSTEAEVLIRQALAAEPQDPALLTLLARCLIKQRRAKEALSASQEIVVSRPDDDYAHRLVSISYLLLGRGKRAVEAARRAVALDPEDGWNHYVLANTLRARLRGDEAKGESRRAVELDPHCATFHILVGQLHRVSEKGVAREAFEEALRLEPENAEALRGLVEVNAEKEGFAGTVRGLVWSLSLDPTDPSPVYASIAGSLRRLLLWQCLLLAFSARLFWNELRAGGGDHLVGRVIVGALLAVGIGFARRVVAQLPEGGARLIWWSVRRKPLLILMSASTAVCFATGTLWALVGGSWPAALARFGYVQLVVAAAASLGFGLLWFLWALGRFLLMKALGRC